MAPRAPPIGKTSYIGHHIRITDTGVFVPIYGHTPDGRIVIKGERRYKDLTTAIRGEGHAIRQIKGYAQRHAAEDERLAEINRGLSQRGLEEKQRAALTRNLGSLRESVEGRRQASPWDSLHRNELIEALDEAAAENHPTRMAAILQRARRFSSARRHAGEAELKAVPGRRQLLIDEKARRDSSALETLRKAMAMHAKVSRGAATAAELEAFSRELARMPEWSRSVTARDLVSKAAESLKRGDATSAKEAMRAADKAMASFASRFMMLPPEILDAVSKSPDSRFRETVARRQLRYAKENVVYWHSPESHEWVGVGQMRSFIRRSGGVATGSPLQRAAEEAAQMLRGRNLANAHAVRARLERAVPKRRLRK